MRALLKALHFAHAPCRGHFAPARRPPGLGTSIHALLFAGRGRNRYVRSSVQNRLPRRLPPMACGRPFRSGHSPSVLDRYSLSGISASDPVVCPAAGCVELPGASGVIADAGAGVTTIVNSWLTARPLSGPPGMSMRTIFVPGT